MGAVDAHSCRVGAAGREVAHADETTHSRDRLQWYRGSVVCVSELLRVLAHAIAKQAPLHALQAIRVGFEHCFSSDINKSAKLMVLLNRAAARSSCFQPVACVLVVSVSCVV